MISTDLMITFLNIIYESTHNINIMHQQVVVVNGNILYKFKTRTNHNKGRCFIKQWFFPIIDTSVDITILCDTSGFVYISYLRYHEDVKNTDEPWRFSTSINMPVDYATIPLCVNKEINKKGFIETLNGIMHDI